MLLTFIEQVTAIVPRRKSLLLIPSFAESFLSLFGLEIMRSKINHDHF